MANTHTTGAKAPKAKKAAVAKHELLGADGTVVEREEEAHGVRYTLLANGASFEYRHGQPGQASMDRWLANFGAKTLATNEASAIKNDKTKGPGTPDEMIGSIRDRFALMVDSRDGGPIWKDRTREGGPTIDVEALAHALCDVQIARGKSTEAERDALWDEKFDKLESDEAYLGLMRRAARGEIPEVAAAYAKRIGRPALSLDDI